MVPSSTFLYKSSPPSWSGRRCFTLSSLCMVPLIQSENASCSSFRSTWCPWSTNIIIWFQVYTIFFERTKRFIHTYNHSLKSLLLKIGNNTLNLLSSFVCSLSNFVVLKVFTVSFCCSLISPANYIKWMFIKVRKYV